MTLRLTVDRAAWTDHVHRVASNTPALVPVVKGNGYGFGRSVLLPVAATLASEVCVGTVFEADHVPDGVRPVVLTPARAVPAELPLGTVLTVANGADVAALHGWHGMVMLKLRSSMQRFGVTPAELPEAADAVRAAGCAVMAVALHLPLAGTDAERVTEVTAWLAHLDPALPLWLSHLAPETMTALAAAHPDRRFRIRVGTALWHGDKRTLHLGADVLAVHRTPAGTHGGYRGSPVASPGHIVVLGAGSSHGIAPLDDGRSPFHFGRQRMTLLELPHMHSSMCLVPDGEPLPRVGDWVDVQRPLINVHADEIFWT